MQVIKAFESHYSIIFYFTISKIYFINYTILFYHIPNILTFILQITIQHIKII